MGLIPNRQLFSIFSTDSYFFSLSLGYHARCVDQKTNRPPSFFTSFKLEVSVNTMQPKPTKKIHFPKNRPTLPTHHRARNLPSHTKHTQCLRLNFTIEVQKKNSWFNDAVDSVAMVTPWRKARNTEARLVTVRVNLIYQDSFLYLQHFQTIYIHMCIYKYAHIHMTVHDMTHTRTLSNPKPYKQDSSHGGSKKVNSDTRLATRTPCFLWHDRHGHIMAESWRPCCGWSRQQIERDQFFG